MIDKPSTDIATYRLNRPWGQYNENPSWERPQNLSMGADSRTALYRLSSITYHIYHLSHTTRPQMGLVICVLSCLVERGANEALTIKCLWFCGSVQLPSFLGNHRTFQDPTSGLTLKIPRREGYWWFASVDWYGACVRRSWTGVCVRRPWTGACVRRPLVEP